MHRAVIGKLPTALRAEVQTVWIHRGTQPFGGGNNNVLIHTGQADLYFADGILEETLVHEASHTSLDTPHASAAGWLAAQAADAEFISTYARDNADREDFAESFLALLSGSAPRAFERAMANIITHLIRLRSARPKYQRGNDWARRSGTSSQGAAQCQEARRAVIAAAELERKAAAMPARARRLI
jgi:hypothetical protein